MTRRIVIVGAGLAGATTATTLRELGFDGELLLVGSEEQPPYERPALSKGYLAGSTALEDLLVHRRDVYADLGIDLLLDTTAAGVDVEARRVRFANGSDERYDALVVATGAVNRRPSLPGLDLGGVHQLRTVGDADALRVSARQAERVIGIGMVFVGCEVAATLRGLGLAVTLVGPEPGPLWGPLGPAVSARVRAWHDEHGARLCTGVAVAAVEGGGRAEQVRLSDGRVLPADLVVVGVGARPATDWLLGSGVRLTGGAVVVDTDGRSSAPDVYAVGDAAAPWDPSTGQHRSVEHYDAALQQGQHVAHALLGPSAPPAGRSWFWSDQYDHTLQFSGSRALGDDLHWRGDTGFYVGGGRVTAVVAMDDGRQFRRALPLVGEPADIAALCDEDVDLRSLRRAAARVA